MELFLFFAIVSQFTQANCLLSKSHIPPEQRVFQKILETYDFVSQPFQNNSEALTIEFQVRLNQIIDLNERHQILTTSIHLIQIWSDTALSWTNADVRSVRLAAERVWMPDTFVFNNADEAESGFLKVAHVIIKRSGEVHWTSPFKLKTMCKVDITYFPFDEQLCSIHFGSWIYKRSRLLYAVRGNDSIDLTTYTDNSDWQLVSAKIIPVLRKKGITLGNEIQRDLLMLLHIRRRSFFYIWNIMVPCIMLTVLTLFSFWTPAVTGEKISLGLSVFLAFSMFMLLVAEQVPPTSESIPLIGQEKNSTDLTTPIGDGRLQQKSQERAGSTYLRIGDAT